MTADVFGARQRSRNFSFVAEVFAREPLYAGAAFCLAALIAPTLVAMTLYGRALAGVNVWLKPLRFEVALTVYLATLAWFAGWLPQGVTHLLVSHLLGVRGLGDCCGDDLDWRSRFPGH